MRSRFEDCLGLQFSKEGDWKDDIHWGLGFPLALHLIPVALDVGGLFYSKFCGYALQDVGH